MFQFIDARLQPITAEVTNGLVHDERPSGLGREPGGSWSEHTPASRLPGPQAFPK